MWSQVHVQRREVQLCVMHSVPIPGRGTPYNRGFDKDVSMALVDSVFGNRWFEFMVE